MPANLQIVLPGLFDLPLHEVDPGFLRRRLPGLNRLLRLASPISNQSFSIDSILRQALGWPRDPDSVAAGLPLAQAFTDSAAADAERQTLFELVHLRADLHSALLVPIQKNRDNLNDIHLIINDLSDIFKVDCDIVTVAEGCFLMSLNAIAAPTDNPHLLSVLGKPVNPYIEQSRAHLPWYQLLNEMQMFLHQHELNQARLQRGQLPLNSLWCWGAGRRPAELDSTLGWYCDDPLLNRFAQSLGLRPRSLAEITVAEVDGDSLAIDLRLLEALKAVRADASLEDLLLDVEHQLISPFLDAARRQRGRLCLRAGFEFDFVMPVAANLRFWRRRKYLDNWLGGDQFD